MSARLLYRAVSLAEAEDIRNIGAFRCIPGSMETKLFVTNETDAARLARDVLFVIDREPQYIASIELPEIVFESLLAETIHTDFQIRTIGIEEADLLGISALGRIAILSFCSLPG